MTLPTVASLLPSGTWRGGEEGRLDLEKKQIVPMPCFTHLHRRTEHLPYTQGLYKQQYDVPFNPVVLLLAPEQNLTAVDRKCGSN